MERQTVGVYQLKRLLGQGGMGAVYLAHDPRLSRDVALKVLSPALAGTPGFRERFLAEARSCSRLNHPNITTIHEIGEEDGLDFIAFEYVEGENLESVLEREERFSPGRTLEIAIPLASALSHAHERGVVHRDLKPPNVILSSLGIPKILDFGLAKALPAAVSPEGDTLARLTQAGMIVGTIAYMAPEQALGEAVDARSDVFAFGCLLYEMLSGRPPFRGSTPTQVLDGLLHRDPEPLDFTHPEVPSALARIVSRAMRKSAGERFQTMDELLAELRRVGDRIEAPNRASRALPLLGRTFGARRNRYAAGLAGVGAVAVTFLLVDSDRASDPSRDAVAVMYFENLSDPSDSDRTARMLAELVTSEIAAAPALEIVSRQRLADVARGLGRDLGEIDRAIATEVAKAALVETMVLGQVALAGERVMASVTLVDVESGRSLSSERAQVASSEDVLLLAESLGAGVRDELGRLSVRSAPVEEGSSRPTGSLEAYRHYVGGETALHASDLETAVEELSEAVRLDPEFALAQFRLSVAARWMSDGPLAHQAARRAAAGLDRAPAHLRAVIEANALYQDGAYSQAVPLLKAMLDREPDQKEALYILSQIYVHSLRDGDPGSAIELMEKLLSLDPGFEQVYDRLALSYAFQGDLDRARELLATWEPRAPEKVEGLRSILATLEGQPEEALGFGQAFSWIEGPLFQTSAAIMASRWEIARSLVDQDRDEWRSDHLRAWSLRNRAVLHTYLGEFDRAVEVYRQAGMATGLRTHEGASGGVPASALQLLAELYAAGGEPGAARAEAERALRVQPESWRALYYAGKMAFLDGDLQEGSRYLEKLRRIPSVSRSAAARVYLRALQGEEALAGGEAKRARDLFASAVAEPLMLDWASSCSSAGAAIRDGLVRACLALGREREAMKAMEDLLASGAERVDHPVLYQQALYRLGVMEIEKGSEEKGRRLLSRFLASWGDPDWELDIVADARKRLAE